MRTRRGRRCHSERPCHPELFDKPALSVVEGARAKFHWRLSVSCGLCNLVADLPHGFRMTKLGEASPMQQVFAPCLKKVIPGWTLTPGPASNPVVLDPRNNPKKSRNNLPPSRLFLPRGIQLTPNVPLTFQVSGIY